MDRLPEEWFKEPFLAIVLDTANTSRISDPRWKKAKFKIKIDHHPEVEKYGKVQVVRTDACAAAEILTDILLSFKGNYVLSKEAASYLYSGIAGDSGRFQYSSTSKATFITASYLLEAGVALSDVYNRMYQKKLEDLKSMLGALLLRIQKITVGESQLEVKAKPSTVLRLNGKAAVTLKPVARRLII